MVALVTVTTVVYTSTQKVVSVKRGMKDTLNPYRDPYIKQNVQETLHRQRQERTSLPCYVSSRESMLQEYYSGITIESMCTQCMH